MTPCRLVNSNGHFNGSSYLPLQIGLIRSTETSVSNYQHTLCNKPAEIRPDQHRGCCLISHFLTCKPIKIWRGYCICICGPGSSVDIANGYGLDGSGIESRWGRDFPQPSRSALRTTQPPVKWVPSLSQG